MDVAEAREHKEHMCDVWPINPDDEHIGVIEGLSKDGTLAFVSGHPEYAGRHFSVSDLGTSCKLVTYYLRPKPETENA